MKKLGLLFPLFIITCIVFSVSCVTKEVPVTETYYETEYRTETYTETENVVVNTKEGEIHLSPITKWQAGISFGKTGLIVASITYYYGYEIDVELHPKSKVKITISPGAQEQNGKISVYNLTDTGQISPMPTPVGKSEVEVLPEEQAWADNLNVILGDPRLQLGYQEIFSGSFDSHQGTTEIWWYKPTQHLWITGGNQESIDLGFFPTKTEASKYLKDTEIDIDFDHIIFDASGVKEFAVLANTWHAHSISDVTLCWTDGVIEKQTVTKERQVPYEVEKQRTVMQTKKVPFWEVILH